MPVQLPNPPTGPTLLPPPPQDPPTLVDISNAAVYHKQILDSYEAGIATRDDVGAGAIYQAAVIARNADAVAPPWFAPAVAASLTPLMRFSYITHNRLCGDGHTLQFRVVPFINGELPTDKRHNLPPLVNVTTIGMLTEQQTTAYLAGYNLPIYNAIAECKEAIRVEIGCTAGV